MVELCSSYVALIIPFKLKLIIHAKSPLTEQKPPEFYKNENWTKKKRE